ncbi:MAG: fibronectin type III domain-containing protein [Acidobacteria bacterium]|nr:fibronectin type III domain-containing protein [Acidobacteriota bacterium]
MVLRPLAAACVRFAPGLWAALERGQNQRGCPTVTGEPIIALHSWTEHIIASAIVAATAVVVYYVAVTDVAPFGALVLAFAFAFGTSAWSTASRALWQHGPSMLLLSLALLMQRRERRSVWIGMALAFAYVVRPTNAIPLAACALWILTCRRSRFPQFLFGVGAVIAPFLISNLHTYGTWLSPYYYQAFSGAGNRFVGEALVGDLISPNRGLFVYSPVFAFSLAALAVKLRTRRVTALDLSLAGCLAVHWIVIATMNQNWWGGSSYGPRFFSDVVPYLVYFLVPAIAWIESARGATRAVAAALFAGFALVSVGMHAQGALNKDTIRWNLYSENIDVEPLRVWDWRRPQFLAGLTFVPAPLPPVDLDAIACTEPPAAPAAPTIVLNRDGDVTLGWPAAAGPVAVYLVEVGTTSGARDQPTREVRDVQRPVMIARRVPVGTYYVRVRGRNRCGLGPPSPEVVVIVR